MDYQVSIEGARPNKRGCKLPILPLEPSNQDSWHLEYISSGESPLAFYTTGRGVLKPKQPRPRRRAISISRVAANTKNSLISSYICHVLPAKNTGALKRLPSSLYRMVKSLRFVLLSSWGRIGDRDPTSSKAWRGRWNSLTMIRIWIMSCFPGSI